MLLRPTVGGFSFMVILDPHEVPFYPAIFFCLGFDILFKSILRHCEVFSADFNFRQQEDLVENQKMSGWIQAIMQQNTITLDCLCCWSSKVSWGWDSMSKLQEHNLPSVEILLIKYKHCFNKIYNYFHKRIIKVLSTNLNISKQM